jgi:ribose-phosphate pyrophosphokinase
MRPLLISGSAHPSLAAEIARELDSELAPCLCQRFPDGEMEVEVRVSVRGQAMFIVQPLGLSIGEHLLELLLLSDACRRAGAASVTALIPYVGFARQDRVTKEGQPLGAKVLAEALGTGGFSQIVAVDLHSPVIASGVNVPVAHVTAVPLIADALRPMVSETSIVVAPDLGAVKLADAYARALGLPLAIVSKVRVSPVEVAVQKVVGDVRAKRPIVVDDMISTGRTIDAAVDALLAHGCYPHGILVATTHGLFVGGAADRLSRPEVVRVMASDSLPLSVHSPAHLRVVGLARLFAEVVRRIAADRGLDDLLATR